MNELMLSVKHIIDLDADPFVPDVTYRCKVEKQNWKVEEHKKGGQFEWDPAKVELFLSEDQKGGKLIASNKLRKELADQSVFNANLLDYLLAHPELISEDWKGKYVFFWGTIYRYSWGTTYLYSDCDIYVRYLYCYGGRWDWGCSWLGGGWGFFGPAAVRARPALSGSSNRPLINWSRFKSFFNKEAKRGFFFNKISLPTIPSFLRYGAPLAFTP